MQTATAMAQVKDLNAVTDARRHDLMDADGKITAYDFMPGRYTEVPLALATRWLVGNIGFEVKGPDGQILKLVAQPQDAAGGRGMVLRPDQVIASLDELTQDALIARAAAKGGKFTKASGKKAVVEFLLAGGVPLEGGIDDTPENEALGVLLAKD